MPPSVALLLWLICLLGILRFDPARQGRTSWTLWVPLSWMFFAATRLPSQWLSPHAGIVISAQGEEHGNPTDRLVYTTLMVLAIGILAARRFPWGSFFQRNIALTAFLFFCLLSVAWSDFPFVAFKRWFRDIGGYVVLLVILSDPQPLEAIRTTLRRLCYLAIPLSVMLVKYYPALGVHYGSWTGAQEYVGATTSKNMLGLLCLVSGLFFFWDTLERWSERKRGRGKQIILLNAAFFAMTVWLLHLSRSTTSSICLLLGCLVIAAAHSKAFRRHPALLKALIPAAFGLYLVLDFVLGMNGSMAHAVGKDPTLHDRTKIWAFLLSMHTNALVGTGYQSFWLGPRLEWFWENAGLGHVNEAHNGYLEVYLELGLIGCGLLGVFLITSYRGICRRLETSTSLAILGLAVWLGLIFYNMSEAAFGSGLLYTVFLMVAIAPMHRATSRVHSVAAVRTKATLQGTDRATQLTLLASERTAQRR